jgi:hypothetical protein
LILIFLLQRSHCIWLSWGVAAPGVAKGGSIRQVHRHLRGMRDDGGIAFFDRIRHPHYDDREVTVIAAMASMPSARAAKAATETIPIVFAFGGDPVQSGRPSRDPNTFAPRLPS